MAAAPRATGPWRRVWRRVIARRASRLALGVLLLLALAALLAPFLAPYDPAAQLDIVHLKSQPPSWAHPLGTDPYSRDLLSRMLFGARVSLSVALLSVLVSGTVGTAIGAVAGLRGGAVDLVLMRLVDALLAIPRVLFLLALVAVSGQLGLTGLVLVLGLTGWFGVSRLVRAEVLQQRERDFVAAARTLGASEWRLLTRHILPNVLTPVIVATTLGIGTVIALEAGLSYLGVGVRPPFASWGNIIEDGASQLGSAWWISLFPGLAIVITVLAVNVVGDALREALDPRQLEGSSV